MSLLHPELHAEGEIVVEVELRGRIERIRWSPTAVEGEPDAVARLRRLEVDLDDPVRFLQAVRSAFGDRVRARVGG